VALVGMKGSKAGGRSVRANYSLAAYAC
jgi:hypothetical protein